MGILAAPHDPVQRSSMNGRDGIAARLRAWHDEATALRFFYSRSLGGLVQSGRGSIAMLDETALTIDAGGSTLLVMLAGAAYDDTPQIFFTPDLDSHFQVAGISISLGNHDWLFFFPDEVPLTALSVRNALR
ncbi:hypothetical protein [Telluria beijingensis]|uniref:hypothetical protein n=1 Tax=Telluria beijingensis TaxID=3068633 RepID=UPI002795F2A3|nr:hypothetical protein [Massilia sp. REN29]